MASTVVQRIKAAGVIGAGGAGFPTHVKAGSRAEIVIANGAECEPLSQVDQQLMVTHADSIIKGLSLVVRSTGATRGVVALKKKYIKAIESISTVASAYNNIEVFLLEDFYPAGDELLLVHIVTGRAVPERNIPISVGVVVQNVGTLMHISDAHQGIAVTHRYVSVLGEVVSQVTAKVPIGMSFGDVIALAGGSRINDYAIIYGGPMMGKVTFDRETPVAKTTSALLVLPLHHMLVEKKTRRMSHELRLIKACCTQCTYCTELCPRYLLGHELHPHKIMRALNYKLEEPFDVIRSATFCSECGVCEMVSCNMGLSPCTVNREIKAQLAKAGFRAEPIRRDVQVREAEGSRKVSMERLIRHLNLGQYHSDAPLVDVERSANLVRISLQQHIGAPSIPTVQEGDRVQRGDLVADIPKGALGARYHASIYGVVKKVNGEIVIEAA